MNAFDEFHTALAPDGTSIPMRLRRSGSLFIEWIKWQNARESEKYIGSLKASFEAFLGVELLMTWEEHEGDQRGYIIRWSPLEIYTQPELYKRKQWYAQEADNLPCDSREGRR